MIDVFKVGVHIAMTSNAAQALGSILHQLTGLNIAAKTLVANLETVRTAALSTGTVFVGWKVLDGLWHAIEDSRDLNKELEKTKQLGGDFAANLDKTRAAAFQTSRDVPTSVVSDNVRLGRELGTTIGKPEAADEMLPEAAKTAAVVSHYTGEKEEDIIKNLIRTADARGQIYTKGADGKEHVDPVKLARELNAAARGLILGGGFIKSDGLLQMARQGGTVAKEQTPEAFYAAGVEAGIALGASKTGTAETSLMQEFVGGKMTEAIAEHLTEAGILHDGEWHSGKGGGVVMDPKAAQRFEPMLKDPVAWLSTGEGAAAVKAYAQKEGISVVAAIMQIFGRQTTQRLASEAMGNEPQFARARQIYGNIPDVAAQYEELRAHDLDTNIKSVAAAWKSFTEAVSDAGTGLVIPILHLLTDAIHLLTEGAAKFPVTTEVLLGLVGGISGLTVLGGSLRLLNLCWSPLVNGLRLLFTTVQAEEVAAVATGATTLGTGIAGLAAALVPFAVGGAAALALAALMDKLHDLAGFGNKEGFAPMTGGPSQGAAPAYHGPDVRPPSVAPMPGDKDFSVPVSPYVAPPPLPFHRPSPAEPSAAPPATKGDKQALILNIDGKRLASIVLDHGASYLSRPSSGPNGTDLRISPVMPGLSPAYG